MPDQEQPEVVLADPQRLQALRRALEERGRRARQARAVATELRWEALRCED